MGHTPDTHTEQGFFFSKDVFFFCLATHLVIEGCTPSDTMLVKCLAGLTLVLLVQEF